MFSPLRSVLAVLVVLFFVTTASAQQRPTAPVGYMVSYSARDGKALSDGKVFRIAGVYRNFADASKQFNYLNSIHMYRANFKNLYSEAEYKAAMTLYQDPKTGLPDAKKPAGGDKEKRPEIGAVSGSQWKCDTTTFTFKNDGSVVTNYGTKGRWEQKGNTVSWSISDTFVFKYTGTVSGNSMTIDRSIYNPKTGNEGQTSRYGTATRLGK